MSTFAQFAFGMLVLLASQVACASPWKSGAIYDGSSLSETTPELIASRARPGTVVIVSENHGFAPHHENQVGFLEALAKAGHTRISVGMEFFHRGVQQAVDRFLGGLVPEPDFLKEVSWGAGISFDCYRRQVVFPQSHGGRTIAINAPRAFTSRVSKVGLAGLTDEEKKELPPGFTLGNALYFERFKETMSGHVPEAAISRYFESQSVWDETMAWVTTEYLKSNPEQVFVIIVGDFHAAYGGGLPDRLKARGAEVLTISQVNLDDLSSAEELELVGPDAKYGPRGDFVWVSRTNPRPVLRTRH